MSAVPQVLNFIKGDTFEVQGLLAENGQPVDLTEVEIRSQVRDASGTLIADLVATKLDQVSLATRGRYKLRAEALDTAAWPVGNLQFNVKYVGTAPGSNTNSTKPVTVVVKASLTA